MAESELRVQISVQLAQAKEALRSFGDRAQEMAQKFGIASDRIAEDIDKIQARTDELGAKGADIKVKLEDDQARIRLEQLKSDIDTLHRMTASIKVDDTQAMAQVEMLREKMYALSDEAVAVHLHDSRAILKLDELEKKLTELHDKTVDVRVRHIREMYEGASAAGPGMFQQLRGRVGGFGKKLWGGLRSALIPAAIAAVGPVAVAATSAVMGLAGAFTAAAAGVGAFAVVAVPDLKGIFAAASAANKAQAQLATATTASQRKSALHALALAYYGLDGAQLKAVHSLQTFQAFFKDFVASFNTPVLHVFSDALGIMRNVLEQARPVIQAAATAISGLMDSMDRGVRGGALKSTFQWMAREAGPAIQTFAETVGNFLRGFMLLMEAFTPAAHDMEKSMVGISKKFAEWAAHLKGSAAMKQFLTDWRRDGPLISRFINELASAIGKVIMLLEPFGALLFVVADGLLQLINVVAELLLRGEQFVERFVLMKSTTEKMEGPLRTVTAAMRLLGTIVQDVSRVVRAAFTVVEAFVLRVWRDISNKTRTHWKEIETVVKAAATLIETIIRVAWTLISDITKKSWGGVEQILKGVWDIMKGVVKLAVDVITGIIVIFLDLITGHWSRAWDDLKAMTSQVWGDIVTIIKGAVNVVEGIVRGLLGIIEGAINAVKSLIGMQHQAAAAPAPALPNYHRYNHYANIPRFATGGIVRAPTLALVGEAGPEAILPLSRFPINKGATSSLGTMAGIGRGAATVINVYVSGNITENEQKLAETVGAEMMRRVKMRGLVS